MGGLPPTDHFSKWTALVPEGPSELKTELAAGEASQGCSFFFRLLVSARRKSKRGVIEPQ